MRILLLCLFLIPINGISQEYVDNDIAPHFEEWLIGANKYKVNLDTLNKKIDTIKINKNLKFPLVGRYCEEEKTIEIAEFALIDKNIVKVTLFHEIGHVYGLGHVFCTDKNQCNDIMAGSPPSSFSKFANEWYFYYLKENYFAHIKFYDENPHLLPELNTECTIWKSN